jgi:hypothetical protein
MFESSGFLSLSGVYSAFQPKISPLQYVPRDGHVAAHLPDLPDRKRTCNQQREGQQAWKLQLRRDKNIIPPPGMREAVTDKNGLFDVPRVLGCAAPVV